MSSTEELVVAPEPRIHRFAPFLITLVAMGIYVGLALRYRTLFLGNAVDDAYISFRYLDNLLAGQGLVYNPGERVEGFSNFLWILLLVPMRLLGAPVTIASQVLGLVFGCGTIALAVVGARRIFGMTTSRSTAFVALLPATSGYFAAWSISGLEGTLYAFLLVATWLRFQIEYQSPEKRPFSALLLTAVAMTRPEGIFLSPLFAAVRFFQGRPPSTRRFLLWLLPSLGAYEVLRVYYYGPHFFSNAVRAKLGFGFATLERGLAHLHENFASPYLLLLLPLLLLFRAKQDPALFTAISIVCFQVLVVVAVGGDWAWGRLYAPILPLGGLALAATWAEISSQSEEMQTFAVRMGAFWVGAAYLLFACFVTGPFREMRFFSKYASYDQERLVIGAWLREKAPKDAKLAVFAAGEIPWASGLYTHDMLGLNDAHIADLSVSDMGKGAAGHEKFDIDYTLNVVKPDIIIDGHLVPNMQASKEFAAYELLPGFQYNSVFVTENMADLLGPVPAEMGPSP